LCGLPEAGYILPPAGDGWRQAAKPSLQTLSGEALYAALGFVKALASLPDR